MLVSYVDSVQSTETRRKEGAKKVGCTCELCSEAASEKKFKDEAEFKEYLNSTGKKNATTLSVWAFKHLLSLISYPEVQDETEVDRFISAYAKVYQPIGELTNSYTRI